MREILFRAWLKDKKKMVGVEEIHFRHQFIEYYDGNYDDCWLEEDLNNVELMQYIGFKAKHGVKIFENDIVKYRGETYQVLWGKHSFCFVLKDKHGYLSFGAPECKYFKVIGNIYENPELLEVTENE